MRVVLALCVAIAFVLACGDRVGFEGDDLNVLEGMAYFDLRPVDTLYRFPWQPLSYVLGAKLVALGLPPLGLIQVAQVCGAAGLVLLVEVLRSLLHGTARTALAWGLLLLVPELWITCLYFNTTAVGLPWFCASLWLLVVPRASPRPALLVLAGVLFALACLLRMDFAVAAPLLALLVYHRAPARPLHAVACFVLPAALAGLAGLAALGLSPLQVVRGAGDLPNGMAWTARDSLAVLVLSILPLLAAGTVIVTRLRGQRWPALPAVQWALLAAAAMVPLYPLHSLYSGKYLVPAFCLGLLGLAWLLHQPQRARSAARGARVIPLWMQAAAGAGIVLLVHAVGLQVDAATRSARPHWQSTRFNTHDGPRPMGAYLGLIPQLRDAQSRPGYLRLSRAIAGWLDQAPLDATVVLEDGYRGSDPEWRIPQAVLWSFGWPALFMQGQGWKMVDYQPYDHVIMRSPDGRTAQILTTSARARRAAVLAGCVALVGPAHDADTGDHSQGRYAGALPLAPCEAGGEWRLPR